MMKAAIVLVFTGEGDNVELTPSNETVLYELDPFLDICTVFWSHRIKAFIVVTTHDIGTKIKFQSLNTSLSVFFKSNQQIETHLLSKLAPPKELARYQVWNRQIEDMWAFVSKKLREWV